MFQSTLPRGERPTAPGSTAPGSGVSIHAPARGATNFRRVGWNRRCVSIHAPARGATKSPGIKLMALRVSIHAPARGATNTDPLMVGSFAVSIHAPARGATPTSCSSRGGLVCFNPRSREGSDQHFITGLPCLRQFQSTLPRGERLMKKIIKAIVMWVSIHAPARGATH